MQACTPHMQARSPIPYSSISSFPHSSLLIFLHCLFYIPCTSLTLSVFVSLSVSVSNSLSTSSKIYCFSALRSLLFLCHFVLLAFLLASTHSFPASPCLYTFSIMPYAVCPSTLSFSLISPLHSSVNFICSFIAFFAYCLLNSLSIAPSALYLFVLFFQLFLSLSFQSFIYSVSL